MKSIIFILLVFFTVSCLDFSISEEEMVEYFRDYPLRPESETVTIDEQKIHYVFTTQGRKWLVVFIHGSPGSWSAFIDFFRNDTLLRQFDLLSIDRPGYGLSDPGRPVSSLKKQADLLSHVLKKFPDQQKILVGHSLGGPVAVRTGMDHPDLVDALVLVAPSIDPELEKYEWYRSWIKTRAGGWITPTDFWVSNEEIVPLKGELEAMLPLWNAIKAPVIVIQGTKDRLVPKENAEFARRMLPDSLIEVRYLEGVDHFIPWSDPDKIVQAVTDLKLQQAAR